MSVKFSTEFVGTKKLEVSLRSLKNGVGRSERRGM